MMSIMCLLLTGYLGLTDGGQYFSNTEFSSMLGLYYERLTPIQVAAGIWRATIFLDLKQSKDFLEKRGHKIEELHIRCRDMAYFRCNETFGLPWISRKLILAKRTQKSLLETIEVLKQHSKFHSEKVLPSTVIKRKRNTPWFGFIGKIAGPITGILNYEDGERYEQAIEELGLAQSNISRIMGEQTHLVRSELHKIHQLAKERDVELNIVHKKLEENFKNLTKINRQMTINKFESLALAAIIEIEYSIEEYQEGLKEVLAAIRAAQAGTLHPSMITTDQIITMATEIREAMPGIDFPIPLSTINIIDFISISKVSIRMQGSRILVAVDIPLLGRDVYDLYKLHQIPIPQSVQPKADRAYILPKSKYLELERDNKRYFYLNDDILQLCKMSNNKYVCQLKQPIYDVNLFPSCEVNLLRKPTLEILRTCDIRLSTNQQPYWTPLLSLGGWLYAIPTSETARLACNGGYPENFKVKGNGILQIAANCVLQTESVTLTALPIFDDPTQYVYDPQLNLSISDLSPGLTEYRLTTMDMTKSTKNLTLSPLWDSEKSDVALADLERQWNVLSENRIKLHQNQIITHTTLGGCTLLIILFFIYLFRNQLKNFLDCITPGHKKKRNNNTQKCRIYP